MTDDSNNPVCKGEFRLFVAETRKEFAEVNENMATKKEFAEVRKDLAEAIKNMATKRDLAELEEKMVTKKDHDRLMTLMDEWMTEVRESREERILLGRQVLRIDDIVFDHEKRIGVLEKV